jgi:hypothetical protein
MSEEDEKGPRIIEAHQDLIGHIEKGAGKMRVLSLLTVGVAGFLAVAYIIQLVLPLTGTTSVTVNLEDPVNIATEAVVLALILVWLYVGATNLRFAWRMEVELRSARSKEKEIQERLS